MTSRATPGTTTIKVSRSTRDRLKAQAAAAHLTLGELLEKLADDADRAHRLAALGAAIAATSDRDMASYVGEVEHWENTELADSRGQ